MLTRRVRHLVATHGAWWCLAGIVLTALQPFLFTHFRQDGWEDEAKFCVRNVSAMALFEPDDRSDHKNELETTLYVPASAHIDVPDAFQHGLNALMALVLSLLPFMVALAQPVEPAERILHELVPHTSGAPPPTALWLSHPPKTAPPLST